MKTSTLTDLALDYAAALAEGFAKIIVRPDAIYIHRPHHNDEVVWRPTYSSAGDRIIDREKIDTQWCWNFDEPCWQATIYPHSVQRSHTEDGATRREAALRVWVQHKLGDDVAIPERLK